MLARLIEAVGGAVSKLPFPRSMTSSIFQPMSLPDWPELRPQRSCTEELPATDEGRLYWTSCQAVSSTGLVVDHTLVQETPSIEASISAVSPAFNPSQRRN